jgi:MT0933-like antitoxin protein
VGFLDDAKKKLGDAVDRHGDKISEGLDKAGHAIDERTGGKYRDKIDTGLAKTKDALDGLDGKQDDLPSSSSQPPEPPEPGADPNEDIAAGTRPVPPGGPK